MSQRRAVGIRDAIAAGNWPRSGKAALRHRARLSCAVRNGSLWGFGHRVGAHGAAAALGTAYAWPICEVDAPHNFLRETDVCLDLFVITISVPLCSLGLSDWWYLWGSCCPSFI